MNWLGQGPYRVYKNRLAGQEVFTHTKPFNYIWTGQSSDYAQAHGAVGITGQWTYPEFEGYHGQLYWATLITTEQPITAVTPKANLFLRVLTPPVQNKAAGGQINPVYPPGSISFLDGISPIGNKFDDPSDTGPAGQANMAKGLYAGEVDLFFGGLPPGSDAGRGADGRPQRGPILGQ